MIWDIRRGNEQSWDHKSVKSTGLSTQTDSLFIQAEHAGLRLAIKGRLCVLLFVGTLLIVSRGVDRAPEFIAAIVLFGLLGFLHYKIIGSKLDKAWVKYVFISVDAILLSMAVAIMPPEPGVTLPQAIIFRFDIFPFYFVILAIAAFSFSPGLLLWSGIIGAAGWLSAFKFVERRTINPMGWLDIPESPTTDQYLGIILDPGFIAGGSRLQEAVIFAVVAFLLAVVMRRARQTVSRQLAAERNLENVSEVFGQFVPKVVADAMIRDQGVLDPVEREATALFVDIAGFTSLTEEKGASGIVDILNAWFDDATDVIAKRNGVVTQFQGDAILAIFNLPHTDQDHAIHALEAAKDLLTLANIKQFSGEALNIRIGVNTGSMVAGNVGGGGRQTYTVHGDAVNLAARLEALNKDYGTSLLVSGHTVEHLGEHALYYVGDVKVRGLSEPVAIYSVQ